MTLKRLYVPFLLLGAGACATATPVAETGTTVSTKASASSSNSIRWSGTLQPTQQRTGTALPTSQNKAFGTVTLTSRGSERTAVSISLSTPLQNSTSLSWALHPGRCGSGSPSLVGRERFPMIDVSGNGRGQLNNEMVLALPETGTYHVNIFWGQGQALSDVMTCANLHRE